LRKTTISLISITFIVLVLLSGVFLKLGFSQTVIGSTDSNQYLTISDLDWTVGAFEAWNRTLTFLGMDGFTYEINDQIHFLETGLGTYYPVNLSYVSVGAFATVPVTNGKLNFTFEGRAKAGHLDAVNLCIRIYEPDPLYWLNSSTSDPEHIGGISQPGELDTGYIFIETDVTLKGYDEVIIFLYYNDHWATNWNQEFWIKDLRVSTNPSEFTNYYTINDLDWSFGCFPGGSYDHGYPSPTLNDYGYEINSSSFHVWEINNTFMFNAGAYALVPVMDAKIQFSFEARAKAGHLDAVVLGVVLIDPNSMNYTYGGTWIYNYQETYDTGFNEFTKTISVPDFEEIYLFFYYGDYWITVWGQEIWIQNLRINISTIATDGTKNPFSIDYQLTPIFLLILFGIITSFYKKMKTKRDIDKY